MATVGQATTQLDGAVNEISSRVHESSKISQNAVTQIREAGSIVRPWRGTANATTVSRPSSSRDPTTATSSTSGCSITTASTSAGETQMPPALIMSLLRPWNVQ